MAGGTCARLAAAVTSAGGFGFIQTGYDPAEKFEKELFTAREILGTSRNEPLRIGVGFIGWILDERPELGRDLIPLALQNRVSALWFAFGADLRRWIQLARTAEAELGYGQQTPIFVQLSSPQEAVQAVEQWGADVIVAQGIEAGGHGSATAPPLLSLIPSTLAALRSAGLQDVPVLATGGLARGSQVAAVLALGADGAVLGTRFLLSHQSLYTDAQKKVLQEADATSTVRSMAFDYSRWTVGWPAGIDGRGVRNRAVEELEDGSKPEELRERYAEAVKEGRTDRAVVWSGQGVGLVSEVADASDIVRELHEEAVLHLRASAGDILDAP
ncbi:NPD-domain-containing protein [Punctularia strigosozonata HHB-11173 SS5]|uniref:NPD-domain-containing protein n=1 Tax=Punctularia strigosozonata (strain HHB-11173) TaxID=741275 RepID=UPI0004416CDA|nr:NPD-domain-containing protein [Punctularia strigosozonata HHB-11173 SS5]EIN06178.1 NPD-domain-containing protein [Punctularia strigosozonata HHB-11173 SS5]